MNVRTHLALFGVVAVLCGPVAAAGTVPLIEASRHHDRAAVAALLRNRPDVNVKSPDGTTALAWAAMNSSRDIAALLLAAGANPNLANDEGVSPLYLAISNRSQELVQLLLSKGADVNLARANGETPLMLATRMGQLDTMKTLLDRDALVNQHENRFDQTALMWAAGNPDAVRLLLEYKADPRASTRRWDVTATIYTATTSTLGRTGIPWNHEGNYTSKKGGQSAIFFAVQKDDLQSVQMLLDAGVDVNTSSADGTTPLLLSLYKWETDGNGGIAFRPNVVMAQFFLDRGAKVDVADGAGYTPLHAAVLVASSTGGRGRGGRGGRGNAAGRGGGRGVTAAEADLQRQRTGAAVPTRTSVLANGVDPLEMVGRLLKNGANPNQKNLYPTSGAVGASRINPAPPGSTPFHIAAASHNAELVKLLASYHADPNIVRKDGHSPFTVAVHENDLDAVKEMVACGAILEGRYNPSDEIGSPVEAKATRRDGQTVMHIAASVGAVPVIEYLHSLGVGLEAKNAQGETPLMLALNMEALAVARNLPGTVGETTPSLLIKGGQPTPTSDLIRKLLAEKSKAVATTPSR